MLTRSFCCFKGLSPDAESCLWRRGCLSWRHLRIGVKQVLSDAKSASVRAQMPFFEAALGARSADFFVNRLPDGHKLRIFPCFLPEAAFVDIETTGLSRQSVVTVIGVLRNGTIETYVRGRNLPDFIRVWQTAGVLLTFNGTRFDLPFLMREFGVANHPAHIDVLSEAKVWGFFGGLKEIEKKLGYERTGGESGNGEEAVTLWRKYEATGDEDLLSRLIAYNTCDVRSLSLLAQHVWKLSCQHYDAPHPMF